MGYITKQGARNIKTYKPSATVDKSLIYNYILSPLCNYAVNYIPEWVAPNLITAIGFICLVLSSILATFYVGVPPSTTISDDEVAPYALASAVLIFLYMFLDNTDGKQARRTGTSSPLGELIDHGCDSLTVGIGVLNLGAFLGIAPWKLLLTSLFGSITFYLAHWEEYFTHSLVLGMFNGPTEVECLSITVFLFTYALGLSWWRQVITIGPFTFPRNELLVYLGIVMGAFALFQSVYEGLRKAKEKGIPVLTSLAQLLPYTITLVSTALWTYSSPSLFEAKLPLFITSFGFVFSVLVGRCIVQRICSEPFRMFYPIIIPLLVATANSLSKFVFRMPVVNEYTMLVIVWCISFLGWIHFVVSIINEMCEVLNISAFTIPSKDNSINNNSNNSNKGRKP